MPAIVQRSTRVVLGVVEGVAALVDPVGDGVGTRDRLAALLHRRGGSDYLGRAARLEDVLDRQVGGCLGIGRRARFVGRPLRHGQDLARAGLHDHDRAVVRVALAHLLLAGLLGLPLQRGDDRQAQPAAVDRGRVLARGQRDLLTVGADLELLAAGPARQQRVVGVLQPGRTGQVAGPRRMGEAEQVGGHFAIGEDPAVAGLHRDAGQPGADGRLAAGAGSGGARQRQPLDLIGDLLGDPLLEHHVLARGRILEQAQDAGLGHAERPGQVGGDLRHLGRAHHHRVRVDQVGLHREGQRLAVRGRDRATHRRNALALQPLVLRQLQVGSRFKALELNQAPGEQGQHEGDGQQRHPQPPSRVGPRPQYPAHHGARARTRGRPLRVSPGRAGRRPGQRPVASEAGGIGPEGLALVDWPAAGLAPGRGALDAPGRLAPRAGLGRPRPGPPRPTAPRESHPPSRGSRPPLRMVTGCNQRPECSPRRRRRRRWRSCRFLR